MLIQRALRPLLAIAAAWSVAAPAAAAGPLPDLVADPPVGGNEPCQGAQCGPGPSVFDDQGRPRLLLRMDGYVHNRGQGALEIRASGAANGVMGQVFQHFDDGTSVPSAADVIYETNDSHDHWHLRSVMRYSLWDEGRAFEVAPAQKVGFCLVDSEPIEAGEYALPKYSERANDFCRQGDPAGPDVFMGVSAGWRDLYPYVLAFQWVDISDVAPGRYWLRADADPENVVVESEEVNAGAYDAEPTIVNGHRAEPVALGEVDGARRVPLSARTFDDVHAAAPGPREFRIVTEPTGGTLDRPAGEWFAADSVTYTPRPGFSGADSFTFAARDAANPAFPRTPPSAAVTLSVKGGPEPGGVLGISGAPESVRTRSQTQLTASGPGVDRGVTWRATNGTVSPEGLYTAPAYVPRSAATTVTARSATGATGSVTIAIERARKPRPAPTLKPPPVPERGLSRVKLRLHEQTLLAVVSSAQRGKIRFSARSGGTGLGECAMKVRRGSAATCRFQTPVWDSRSTFFCRLSQSAEPAPAKRIVVRASLERAGRTLAERRAVLR